MALFHIDAGKEWRGGQRQSLFLAKELKRREYPVVFVVQPRSPLHRKVAEDKIPYLPIKIRNEFDLLAVLRLAIAMRDEKCLLVHFHDAHSVSVGGMAASLAGVPLRVVSRRVDFPLKSSCFSRQKYTRNIDAVVAISEGVKKVLVKGGLCAEQIQVIPSGIDFSPYQEASTSDYLRREFSFAPDDYLVGMVAHLADHKGHKYLIRATRILKEHTPRIKIIIVGEGPLRMELNKEARVSRVEDMVFFLGFRKDVPRILSSLDLFVLSSYLEGMGTSILDAMACRLPVVATRTGGIPEVVIHGETGLLVPPRSPAALAKAILKLYGDRDLALRLGKRGYEVVHQKFSAQAMAGRMVRLYEKLAAQKGLRLH
ncbi:MAG: glycosyltransferase family 4 protein [Candidatus Aminicenantes bacterium]